MNPVSGFPFPLFSMVLPRKSFRRFRAVEGAISEVMVDGNQLLKQGDPIARLGPRDYEMALTQAGVNLSEKFIL